MIKFSPKFIPWILMVIAIVVAAFSWQQHQESKRKEAIKLQNQIAQMDSIKHEYNKKTGEMEATKAAYVLKEKELQDYNKELSNAVKSEKGKVVTLSKAVISLKQDTTELRKALKETKQEEPIQVNDSTYQVPWNVYYEYDSINSDYFKGVTEIQIGIGDPYKVKHIFTEIKERESRINLTFGQKVENDQLRVFIKSDYPGFKAEELDGVLIDPNTNPYIKKLMKKKHWFTGFGIGLSITPGWDFMQAKPGFVIGPSLHYTIYQW